MEEIVKEKKLTLIGPRAGGISGVFHGPLWLYLNLPFFILGKGNPISVGWFWVMLSIITLIIFFYTAKKIFNNQVAFLATTLYSIFLIRHTPSFFNYFGGLIFTPVYFYYFLNYFKQLRFRDLFLALFFCGLLAQFHVGYGGTILFLTLIYLIYLIFKNKKFFHLLALLILTLPLSTFILFEFRHNFFQVRSVISFFKHRQIAGEPLFIDWVIGRLRGMFFDGLSLMPNPIYNLPVTFLFIWLFYKTFIKKKLNRKETYSLFFFLYLGFWFLMFFYKGIVWGFFYWGFFPLIILIFCSLFLLINKKVFLSLYLIVYLINFYYSLVNVINFKGQWQLYYQMAKTIYQDAKTKEFGYFVYSPDLYGYSGRYALSYVQKEYANKKGMPYDKRKETYLLIEPPPTDKPWLKGDWWVKHQVKIDKKPIKVFYFDKYRIEKYDLNFEEIKIPADPNLIKDTHFR